MANTETPATPVRVCQCGCTGTPASRRSRFLPGHDARLRSVLLAAAEADAGAYTAAETEAAQSRLAIVPDPAWAARWWAARHPADAERAARNAAEWAFGDDPEDA